ncbi:hypothetical protein DID88_005473 [Monilinia fructigena]|uniref:Uncharacterized protein n=1 Tax=Monilinia fructigena TaxID=38457 RepID=A0A395J581_9HELO|nr:hypothetical protein DID88_005473 [Monilinia fructigena]
MNELLSYYAVSNDDSFRIEKPKILKSETVEPKEDLNGKERPRECKEENRQTNEEGERKGVGEREREREDQRWMPKSKSTKVTSSILA